MRFEPEWMGESALLLHFGDGIDATLNARVLAACAALRVAALDGVDDLVPAFASVLVRLDPRAVAPRAKALAAVRAVVDPLDSNRVDAREHGRLHQLPVCYGGDCGADLAWVAAQTGLTANAVIERHCAAEYRVAMLGFAPGFAYLLGLDPRLHVPRRAEPRTRVPSGSIGIGGAQTGIYPSELPGGWQLIGRTPARLFDAANADQPTLLEPADRVRFEPMDAAAYRASMQDDGA